MVPTKTAVEDSPEYETSLLSAEERAILDQIAAQEPPYSQRAQALLAIDQGTTQAEAGRQTGLSRKQVRYWLDKFREVRTATFPEELLNQVQPVAGTPQVSEKEIPASRPQGPGRSPEAEGAPAGALEAEEVVAQQEDAPRSKKNSKKKPQKKAKKGKKASKEKKTKKKAKKNKSKKSKADKGKSGKKKRKK